MDLTLRVNRKILEIAMCEDRAEALNITYSLFKLDKEFFLNNFEHIYFDYLKLHLMETIDDNDRVLFESVKTVFSKLNVKYLLDFIESYIEENKELPFSNLNLIIDYLFTFKIKYSDITKFPYIYNTIPSDLYYFIFTDNLEEELELQNRINILNTKASPNRSSFYSLMKIGNLGFSKKIDLNSNFIPENIEERMKKTQEFCPIWTIELSKIVKKRFITNFGNNLSSFEYVPNTRNTYLLDIIKESNTYKKYKSNFENINKFKLTMNKKELSLIKISDIYCITILQDRFILENYLGFDFEILFADIAHQGKLLDGINTVLSSLEYKQYILDDSFQTKISYTGILDYTTINELLAQIILKSNEPILMNSVFTYKNNIKKREFMKSLDIKLDYCIKNPEYINKKILKTFGNLPMVLFEKAINSCELGVSQYIDMFEYVKNRNKFSYWNNQYQKIKFESKLYNQLNLIKKKVKIGELSDRDFYKIVMGLKKHLNSEKDSDLIKDLSYKYVVF